MEALCEIFSIENGGKLLVEIYLNYDCNIDTGHEENIWERLVTKICKIMTTNYSIDSSRQIVTASNPDESAKKNKFSENILNFTRKQVKQLYKSNGNYSELKKKGLVLLVEGILRSLLLWCLEKNDVSIENLSKSENVLLEESQDYQESDLSFDYDYIQNDDPIAFLSLKQRKVVIEDGIKRFKENPKKGILFLIENGVIESTDPKTVAIFLLNTFEIDKIQLGEFLGEREDSSIEIMHCFVDLMDFSGMDFTKAIRFFVHEFRLPGEAQKIDRLMLKFAERYVQCNSDSFSSAGKKF